MKLKQLWREENQRAYLERQQWLGIPVERCKICGRYDRVGDSHWCQRSNIISGYGVNQKELIVIKSQSGIQVMQVPVVDMDEWSKEYERIMKLPLSLNELEKEKIKDVSNQFKDLILNKKDDIHTSSNMDIEENAVDPFRRFAEGVSPT